MKSAIHDELILLWSDLDMELGESRTWTEKTSRIATRIQNLTKVVGASDVNTVPTTLVEDGTFERLNKMVGAK